MVLSALRGAVGFLTRLPVGHDEDGWDAFRESPWTFPVVGYLVGGLLALAFLLPVAGTTAAFVFLLGVYLVAGVNHLDGVADLGDAAVVHGTVAERREVLKDTTVGVGAVLGVSLVLAGLLSAGLGLAGAPLRAFVLVVAAEVGAKSATALLVCVGSAPHEGLGSALVGEATERAFMPVLAFSLPAVVLPVFIPGSSRSLAVSLAPLLALVAALLTGLLVLRWANENLGGVNGDVLGATTEFSRVVALHVGVIAWTRF